MIGMHSLPEGDAPSLAAGAVSDTGYQFQDFLRRPIAPSPAAGAASRFFCSQCGSPRMSRRAPPTGSAEREVCDDCGSVHYQNPKIVVRSIAEHGGRVLLCRRAEEPRRGQWCTPGGYLENGESLYEAAVREAREEACAEIGSPRLLAIHELPQLREVVMLFRATLLNPTVAHGEECLEAALFEPSRLPWSQLAFPTDHAALRWFVYDAPAAGLVHCAEFFWREDGRILMRRR